MSEGPEAVPVTMQIVEQTAPGVRIEDGRLHLPESLSIEDWVEIGERLQTVELKIQWLRGEWWAFGERKYGEEAYHAVDGTSLSSVKQYAWVARRFNGHMAVQSTEREGRAVLARHEGLSFSHHYEVAALVDIAPERAQEILDRAYDEQWTVRKTRDEVKAIRHGLLRQEAVRRGVEHVQNGKEPYSIVYANPPWWYEGSETETPNPGYESESGYPVERMGYEQVADALSAAMPMTADRAVLFMWCRPCNQLRAIELMAREGFRYRNLIVWEKPEFEQGTLVDGEIELLLIGTRGDGDGDDDEDMDVYHEPQERSRNCVQAASRSRFLRLIERMYPGQRILSVFDHVYAEVPA